AREPAPDAARQARRAHRSDGRQHRAPGALIRVPGAWRRIQPRAENWQDEPERRRGRVRRVGRRAVLMKTHTIERGSVPARRKQVGTIVSAVVAAMAFAQTAAAAGDLRVISAVKNRDADAVRTLLAQHVDVNATQSDGATALHWAVHQDDLAMVDQLI